MKCAYSTTELNIFFCKSLVEIILANQSVCDIIETIIQKKAECVNKPYRGYVKPVLHYAAENGNGILVEKLLNWGTDVNATDKDGRTALHALASTKDNFEKISQTIKALLNSTAVNINKQDSSGRTPLHLALQRDDSLAEMYINSGANVDAQDNHSDRPIHYAVMYKNPKGIALLARHGADVNAQNVIGHSPLMHFVFQMSLKSVESGYAEMLHELMKLNICTDHLDQAKATVISMVIELAEEQKHHFYSVCLSNILNSSNISSQDVLGFCPIHYIILNYNLEMFKDLLKLGCDINSIDSCGRTALHLIPICYSILEKDVTENFKLHNNKKMHLKQICRTFLENGASIHIPDITGRLPLHSAVELGQMDFVDLLVSQEDSNTTLDFRDKTGMAPLHVAASKNQCNIMHMLLKKRVSVNVIDNHMATPLHFACFAGANEAVETLLWHGANVLSKDVQGDSPIEFAELRHFYKCAQMIKQQCKVLAKQQKDKHVDYVPADNLSAVTMHLDYSDPGLWKFSSCLSYHLVNEIKHGLIQKYPHMDKDIVIAEDQPFPDLPLHSEPTPLENVLSCLYDIPGVGLVTTNMPEVNEMSSAITVFLEEIIANVSNTDPRFRGTIIPSGSFFEGTKVGDPDEFDFMVKLDYFSEITSIYCDGLIKISADPNTIKYIRKFVCFQEESPYIDGRLIVEEFQVLFQIALGMTIQHLHHNLQVSSYKIGISTFLLQRTSLKTHSCPMQFIWNGLQYKGLSIDVDVVPVLEFRGLPANARKSKYICGQSSSCLGYHILPHSWFSARLSFSVAEQNIFSKLPEPLLKAFVYAKMLRHKCLVPKLECVIGNMCEETNVWSCDHTQTISTYLLKTIVFYMWDDMKENLHSPIHYLERIYQEVEAVMKGKPINSYFVKDMELCTDPIEMKFIHRAYGVLFCKLITKYLKRN